MDMNDYENDRNIDLKKNKTDLQNRTYLCIAKRVTGHGVNSNFSNTL